MIDDAITIVVPTIPPRAALLARALASVAAQTHPADAVAIAVDVDGDGAPVTRQRGLDMVRTPWVAFLDDDDEMLPRHLSVLWQAAVKDDADYVFSYYEIVGAGGVRMGESDPVLGHFGKPFNPAAPHQTTITTLVRTDIAREAGFLAPAVADALIDGQRAGEDWWFTLGCMEAGARIVHVPDRTWLWHHDSGNTSGRPWKGTAA